ncbi:hypothetical protein OBV_13970 [Oscillibacter valericigenes Sjm18-20]|nr:hypothetical protein OBV_13970 [Oscillibacter valericigenes Sjm18-20]
MSQYENLTSPNGLRPFCGSGGKTLRNFLKGSGPGGRKTSAGSVIFVKILGKLIPWR